jgi:predicted RNA binding protein YcfA (HicA-like mRNA interferase family)
MPKLPGVNHLDAVRALQKAGFRIARQGKHIVMTDGVRILVIPRQNPVNAFTMGGIARDAGLTVEQFRELLR